MRNDERNTRDVTAMMETLSVLPDCCAAWLLSEDCAALIHKGTAGYSIAVDLDSKDAVDEYNESFGIDKDTVNAMLVGSMFGWDVPGANPAAYK
jgi:hypothetical protein